MLEKQRILDVLNRKRLLLSLSTLDEQYERSNEASAARDHLVSESSINNSRTIVADAVRERILLNSLWKTKECAQEVG